MSIASFSKEVLVTEPPTKMSLSFSTIKPIANRATADDVIAPLASNQIIAAQDVDDVWFSNAAECVVSARADNRGGLVFTDRGHNLVIANDGQDCGIRRIQSRSVVRIDEGVRLPFRCLQYRRHQ